MVKIVYQIFDLVSKRKQEPKEFELNGFVQVGRSSKSGIVTPVNCGEVSREHAILNYQQNRVFVTDVPRFGTAVLTRDETILVPPHDHMVVPSGSIVVLAKQVGIKILYNN